MSFGSGSIMCWNQGNRTVVHQQNKMSCSTVWCALGKACTVNHHHLQIHFMTTVMGDVQGQRSARRVKNFGSDHIDSIRIF